MLAVELSYTTVGMHVTGILLTVIPCTQSTITVCAELCACACVLPQHTYAVVIGHSYAVAMTSDLKNMPSEI